MMSEFNKQLLKLYPEYDKVTGPYNRKDGRQHIILVNSQKNRNEQGRRRTVSYPKAIMEVHLQKRLDPHETVDHIDKNPLNNSLDNLQVLSRSEHAALDCKRLKTQYFVCPICQTEFGLSGIKLHHAIDNNNHGKAVPFCSCRCAGKYSRNVQMKKQDTLPAIEIIPEYTTNKGI